MRGCNGNAFVCLSLSRQQFTKMASLTSEFLNFIVFRYLFESGNLILIFRTCSIYPSLIDVVFLFWNPHEFEFNFLDMLYLIWEDPSLKTGFSICTRKGLRFEYTPTFPNTPGYVVVVRWCFVFWIYTTRLFLAAFY